MAHFFFTTPPISSSNLERKVQGWSVRLPGVADLLEELEQVVAGRVEKLDQWDNLWSVHLKIPIVPEFWISRICFPMCNEKKTLMRKRTWIFKITQIFIIIFHSSICYIRGFFKGINQSFWSWSFSFVISLSWFILLALLNNVEIFSSS